MLSCLANAARGLAAHIGRRVLAAEWARIDEAWNDVRIGVEHLHQARLDLDALIAEHVVEEPHA